MADAEFDRTRWATSWSRRRRIWALWRHCRRFKTSRTMLHRVIYRCVTRISPVVIRSFVLHEERAARQSNRRDDYIVAERVYRELRRNFEARKHFQEAYRFTTRELEMRREALDAEPLMLLGSARRALFSLEAMYSHLSRYGESWGRPVAWLAVVLLLATFLFRLFGADLGPRHGGSDWEFLVFALRTAALMPDIPGAQQNPAIQALQVLLRIVAPFLGLLFALAIRRRFRT
jgi:hypothetical protein